MTVLETILFTFAFLLLTLSITFLCFSLIDFIKKKIKEREKNMDDWNEYIYQIEVGMRRKKAEDTLLGMGFTYDREKRMWIKSYSMNQI